MTHPVVFSLVVDLESLDRSNFHHKTESKQNGVKNFGKNYFPCLRTERSRVQSGSNIRAGNDCESIHNHNRSIRTYYISVTEMHPKGPLNRPGGARIFALGKLGE